VLLSSLPFVVSSAFAQCNLDAWVREVAPGIWHEHIEASNSCSLGNGPMELFDNGISLATCQSGPCILDATSGIICAARDHVFSATCTDGACNRTSQSTFVHQPVSAHDPTIAQTAGHLSTDGNGRTGLGATFHIRAVASWGDRVVKYQWLPSGVSAGADQRIGSTDDEVDVNFGAWVPPGETALKATIWACSDKSATTIAVVADYACCCQATPTAPVCAAHPISAAGGNMRMTDTDPLPSMPALPLTRTYDSKSSTAGRFGTGWRSFLDVTANSVISDGDTYLMIRTGDGEFYVFRNLARVWPQNGMPATLTYDGAAGTYTLHEPQRDVDVVVRASDGVPLRYHARSTGRDVLIGYSGAVPVSVADSWGNWSWTLSASGNRITAITIDGTSNTWQYTYDASGLLTTVQGPDNAAWRTYAYSSGLLTEARDAAGRLIESHTYDSARATSSLSSEGDVTAVNYSETQDISETRFTYATGAVTSYFSAYVGGRPRTTSIVGSCSGCGVNDAVYAYDAFGNMAREQDARGYVTTRSFDSQGRLTSATVGYKPSGCDPEVDVNHCRLTSTALGTASFDATPSTATTTYAYGDANWPDRPTLTTTQSVVNASQPRTAAYTYDATTGIVLQEQITGWKNASETETIVSNTALYDGVAPAAFNPGGNFESAWLSLPQPRGLKRSFDGPRTDVADVTQWVYYPVDAAVPPLLRGHLAAVRDAVGNVTRFEAYDAFGNVTRIVDPNGVATESTYDAAGRLLTSTLKGIPGCDTAADPLCATDLISQRTYSPALGPLASETRPGGGTTTYEYDSRRRMTAMVRSVSATLFERAEYDYDAATGKRSAERYKSGSSSSWTLARSEAFAYDSLARLREIDHPDGTKIVYTYDGANNVKTVQDERHTTANTTYAYDPLNRLASVRQTLSSAPGGSILTQYGYDVAGNLTSVVDPNGNTTTYGFDDFSRMRTQVSPVTGTTSYDYNSGGNLTMTIDANGATTTRVYDAAGRVLTAVSACSGWDTEEVAWTYDDPAPGNYGIGRLAAMTDPSGSTSYAYERRGLLRNEGRVIGSSSSATSYAYDVAGNRTIMGDLEYGYDLAGRPVSVSRRDCAGCAAVPLVTSASYLPFGPETDLLFANGTQQTKSYNTRYQVTENKLTGPGTSTIADYSYTNDGAGNITALHDLTDSGFNRDFGYDDLNRLTTANTGTSLWGTGLFSYDAMGNLLSAAIGTWNQSFTFVGTTSRIATSTEQGNSYPVDYDEAGNELDSFYVPRPGTLVSYVNSSVARQYSCRNLMASMTTLASTGCPREPLMHCQPHAIINGYDYSYDGRGVRVRAVDWSSREKQYVYTPELQLAARQDVSSGEFDEFVWFNGHPVAQVSSGVPSLLFSFTDHLGTPLLQTDSSGQVIWRAEYEPYGRVYQLRAGTSEDDQPLRLPGQDVAFQSTTGAEENYNIFRWYRGGWGGTRNQIHWESVATRIFLRTR
jgi:YD repeat-containing protein